MKVIKILEVIKSKFKKTDKPNDLITASVEWFESPEYDALVQAYKDAQENYKFGNVA